MRPAGVRRRRLAFAGLAAAGLVAGAIAGAGGEREAARNAPAEPVVSAAAAPRVAPSESRALAAARRLPLARRVGKLVILRFPGHTVPDRVVRTLRAGRAAGVILFRDNAPTPAALRAVTARLRRAGGRDVIVCTDQEGGDIRTLAWAQPFAAQAALATRSAAAAAARAAARDLRAAGINVTLAPVLDLGGDPGSVMHGRAFPGGARAVARFARTAVSAYRRRGIAAAVKHFPGLGAATANTDHAPVTLARTPAQLVAEELPPFEAAVEAGAPAVMVGHALYPALDARRIASQSRAVVDRLLRRRLGFRGVVMTDAIEAEAVTARSGPGLAAVRSVVAGVDVVLTTRSGTHLRVRRALLARARRSRAFHERVTRAAARVIALQRRFSSQ